MNPTTIQLPARTRARLEALIGQRKLAAALLAHLPDANSPEWVGTYVAYSHVTMQPFDCSVSVVRYPAFEAKAAVLAVTFGQLILALCEWVGYLEALEAAEPVADGHEIAPKLVAPTP